MALAGVTMTVPDPQGTAARWGQVLDVEPSADGDAALLELDGGEVRFRREGDGEGLTEIALRVSDGHDDAAARPPLRLGGVTLRFVD